MLKRVKSTRFTAILAAVIMLISALPAAATAAEPAVTYPWSVVEGGTTGDYLADSYKKLSSGHVFESVTQERLLDILSSDGDYYILFGGPAQETTQGVIGAINAQAKADGIKKIYHFDPFIDGFQIDITDPETPFKTSESVYQLWTRITDLLPDGAPIDDYDSQNTLLFLFNKEDDSPIRAYAVFSNNTVNQAEQRSISKVFRAGNEPGKGPVIASSVRSDFDFFKRVTNGFATYFNYNKGEGPDERGSRTGEETTELFTEADRDGFVFHQVNFPELINLLQSPGDKVFFFGASWCHNTSAIIADVAREAKENGHKVVYVYDTTIGNQLEFGTGEDIDKVISGSSVFNSRNSYKEENGDNNISYLYGEFVKFLGDFITENNSKQNNRIHYFPNGDLDGKVTTDEPWSNGKNKGAIRLQLPFLIAYNKDAEKPVTQNWLHKNAANDGTYTEYMLDYNWINNIGNVPAEDIDGLSKLEFAAEGVAAVKAFFKAAAVGSVGN